ncbi:nucleotidyltransferase domain-containing protein [Thiolapillus sp.]
MHDLADRSGLAPAVIDKINSVFAKYPQIDEVVLYGSRAKGNYRPGSDIDLTIKGSPLSFALLMEIERKLDELLLPYQIDLSLFNAIDNPELIEHIQRVGRQFYRRS